MSTETDSQQAPSSFRIWHDPASRPVPPDSTSSSSDRSSIASHGRFSDDVSTGTVLTSPTISAMSTASTHTAPSAGKKRKRLQRACVACHKAKRRCDGGLPCSNCDFSGRSCAYSDSQGKAVPPTKRTLKPSEMAMQHTGTQQPRELSRAHDDHLSQHSFASRDEANTSMARSVSQISPPLQRDYWASQAHATSSRHSPPTRQEAYPPSSLSQPRAEIRRELLHIFSTHIQPWNCIVDEASLHRDLSLQANSPALMFAIYALSAQYAFVASRRSARSTTGRDRFALLLQEVGDGVTWADEARRILYDQHDSMGMRAIDGNISMETAQTLCLLSCFEQGYRCFETAAAYSTLAAKYITLLSSRQAEGDLRSPHWRSRRERSAEDAPSLRKRLICITALLDTLLGVHCGRGASLRVWDLETAVAMVGDANDSDRLTASLAQQLKTVLLFSSALETHKRAANLAQRSRHRAPPLDTASTGDQARACEGYLQAWADALPSHLRFDEESLHAARQAFAHSNNDSTALALSWSGIHLCAEAAILLLQDATETDLSYAAVQNIAMVLERMSPMALGGPLGTFGIILLKNTAIAGERGARRRLSSTSEGAGLAALKPWNDLEQLADVLANETQLTSWSMANAASGLSLGAVHNALTADFAAERTPSSRSTALSSWMSSPRYKYPSDPSMLQRDALQMPHYSMRVGEAGGAQRSLQKDRFFSEAPRTSHEEADVRQRLPPLSITKARSPSTSMRYSELALPLARSSNAISTAAEGNAQSANTLPPLRF